MIGVKEQCKGCFHLQVCANVLKQQLFIREKMLNEENPKCEQYQPTADVVEVKRGCLGESYIDEYYGEWADCLECGTDNILPCKFCRECGAKMDGKDGAK